MTDPAPSEEKQTERRVVVYMPDALYEALEGYAKAHSEEGHSVSRVIRQACRDFLRRRGGR